jgi:hypothetical protein
MVEIVLWYAIGTVRSWHTDSIHIQINSLVEEDITATRSWQISKIPLNLIFIDGLS